MALLIGPASNPAGEDYVDRYARVVEVTLNPQLRSASVVVGIYASQDVRHAEKQPYERRGLAVTGEDFDALFGAAVLAQEGVGPYRQAYRALAKDLAWRDARGSTPEDQAEWESFLVEEKAPVVEPDTREVQPDGAPVPA